MSFPAIIISALAALIAVSMLSAYVRVAKTLRYPSDLILTHGANLAALLIGVFAGLELITGFTVLVAYLGSGALVLIALTAVVQRRSQLRPIFISKLLDHLIPTSHPWVELVPLTAALVAVPALGVMFKIDGWGAAAISTCFASLVVMSALFIEHKCRQRA